VFWRISLVLCFAKKIYFQTLTLILYIMCISKPRTNYISHVKFITGNICVYFLLLFSIIIWNMYWIRLKFQLCVKRGGGTHVLFTLCLFTYSVVQHILCCVFCFVFLRFVYPLLPVSLDCPFLISPLVFSNVYLQFLWIAHYKR
jgi:hypothetical protein